MNHSSPLFSVANHKFNIVILAAGMGSRLKPVTDHIPKALIELGNLRAIDYLIMKYQHLAGMFIVAAGYCSDLLENYVKGRYPLLKISFSHEEVSALKGPGWSLLYALDQASSKNPTLVTFCDYIVLDQFSVDFDCLGLCRPADGDYVYGTYATRARVEEGVVMDLVLNEDIENKKEDGFTGIGIFHDTKLLKSIVYGRASSGEKGLVVDYAMDVVRPYLKRIRMQACHLSKLFEFGTEHTLTCTREILNEHH